MFDPSPATPQEEAKRLGDFSYVEVENTGNQDLNLNGYVFTEGIKFTFPNIVLQPGGRGIIVEKREDFRARYPSVTEQQILGEYKGSVRPGERVVLTLAGNTVLDFTLRDSFPSLAGQGYPFVMRNSAGNPNDANAWAIGQKGGSPARADNGVPFVTFSRADSDIFFTSTFSVNLGIDNLNGNGRSGTIRYTNNRKNPDRNSPQYSGAIQIDRTMQIRAAVMAADGTIGPILTRTFIKLQQQDAIRMVNIPVVIVETFGNNDFENADGVDKDIYFVVVEPQVGGGGLLANERIKWHGPASGRVRGSSSSTFPKKQFKIETRNVLGANRDTDLFGMPRDSDWVLYGASLFDRTYIHNSLMYKISRDVFKRYAPRTQTVEVLLDKGGNLEAGDYYGSFTFMEKPKKGGKRIDVEKMLPSDTTSPNIEGGWIIKVDRGNDRFTGGGQSFAYVYPKPENLNQAQKDWVRRFWDNLKNEINKKENNNVSPRWMDMLDVDASSDFHLMKAFTKDVDAYRLSTFLHKPRKGKFTWGPVWDFDRALGCTDDGRCTGPENDGEISTAFTGSGEFSFWGELFSNDQFVRRYNARYHWARKNGFSSSNINKMIDELAGQFAPTADKNIARWPGNADRGTYATTIAQFKDWIAKRINHMDSKMCYGDNNRPRCNDNDYCTDDVCNWKDGSCKNIPNECKFPQCRSANSNGRGCDDNDACTDNDTCQLGICRGTLRTADAACANRKPTTPPPPTIPPPPPTTGSSGVANITLLDTEFRDGPNGWRTEGPDDLRTVDCGGATVIGQVGAGGSMVYTQQTVPFTHIALKFRFAFLDSWDDEEAILAVNGREVWRQRHLWNNAPSNMCVNTAFMDSIQEFRVEIPMTGNSVELRFTTTLDSNRDDESFGLSYFRIRVTPVPPPPTVALAALSAGSAENQFTVLDTDFQNGNTNGFSVTGNSNDIRTLTCGTNRVIGQIASGGSLVYTRTGLPQFTAVSLKFRFAFLDSWDDEQAFLTINGQEVWRFSWHFNKATTNMCGSNYNDHIQEFRVENHKVSGNSVTIRFSSTLSNANRDEESFGLAYLRVRVTPGKANAIAALDSDQQEQYQESVPTPSSNVLPIVAIILSVLCVLLIISIVVLATRLTKKQQKIMELRP